MSARMIPMISKETGPQAVSLVLLESQAGAPLVVRPQESGVFLVPEDYQSAAFDAGLKTVE